MTATRSFWIQQRIGDIADLRLQEAALPALAAHKVRVAVRAVGLNFADVLALTGMYSAAPPSDLIPGLEFAGDIIEVGSAVTRWRVGERVFGATRFGAFATVVDAAADHVQPLPAAWDYAQGAAYLVQTFTAWYGLRTLGDVRAGQNALIHSAAGGVGLQAMRFCRALGVNPIGTVSDANKQKFLNDLGFAEVLVREDPFAPQLQRHLAGRPLHLALDAIGGEVQQAAFDALTPTGRLVVFGAAVYAPGPRRMRRLHMLWEYLRRPRYDALAMISQNRSVMAFNLIWLWTQQELFERLIVEMSQVAIPPPHVGHRYEFSRALDAIEMLRSGRSIGKVVLEVGR